MEPQCIAPQLPVEPQCIAPQLRVEAQCIGPQLPVEPQCRVARFNDPVPNQRERRDPEYATKGIDSCAGREEAEVNARVGTAADTAAETARGADDEVDLEFIETGIIRFEPRAPGLSVEERLGMAVLRLRLFRGLSQVKLERFSGVDQTSISRLETATSRGMSVRRLCRLLKALRADEITFGPGERLPQSSWEDVMYGDLWERAGRVAEARVNRRRSA